MALVMGHPMGHPGALIDPPAVLVDPPTVLRALAIVSFFAFRLSSLFLARAFL